MYSSSVPARTDHDARRRDVAAAVWTVLARTGFAGLSLRAVATELGATTGLVTHYFPSKAALVEHALELLHERTDESLASGADEAGLAGLRARLLAVLPRTAEAAELSRIWVGFWDLALVDAELSAREAARYDRWRARLRPLLVQAQERGELAATGVEPLVDLLTAFVHGLVVQALFDPARFPAARQEAALDEVLALLRYPTTTSETA
jgi:AcrR family transcriptional regulator